MKTVKRMVFGRRKKSATEKFLEGQEKRAKALAKAEKELQVQQERATVFKVRAKAQKLKMRAEKLRGPSKIGNFGNPDAIADVLEGKPRKKEKNIFKM